MVLFVFTLLVLHCCFLWVYSFYEHWEIFSHYWFLQLFFSIPSSFLSFWRECPGSEDCCTNSSAGSFSRSLVVLSCMSADQYSAKGNLVWQWHRACVRIMLHEPEKVSWIHLWESLNSWLSNMDFNKKAVGSGWRYSHVWNGWCTIRIKIAAAGYLSVTKMWQPNITCLLMQYNMKYETSPIRYANQKWGTLNSPVAWTLKKVIVMENNTKSQGTGLD